MKKVVTAVVLFALWATPALTVTAQKTRNLKQKFAVLPSVEPTETIFDTVQAFSDGSGVMLRWSMKQEVKNIGFDVYRLDSKQESRVTSDLVLGAATRFHAAAVSGQSYEYFVPSVDAEGVVYFVEAVGMNGQRVRSAGVVPTVISDLDLVSKRPIIDNSAGIVESKIADVPKELASEIESNISAPNPTVHRSVIARPGVKLGVKGEGLFRVSRAQLQAAGFDVNGDSSLWQLYVNGNEQAINIGPNADYIEFYGKGVDTVESDIQTYYLVTGATAGKRIAARVTRPSASTVTAKNYPETVTYKERTNYLSQIFNGPGENYVGRAVLSTATTYPFVLSGVNTNGPDAVITVSALGYSFDAHSFEISLNGHALAPIVSVGRQTLSTTVTIPASWLVEGTNNLQMRSGGPSDISWFDYVQVSYSRTYLANQNTIKSFTPNYKITNIDGFTSANVRVFDITDPDQPVLMAGVPVVQNGSTFTASIPASRGRMFYALEDTAVKSVQSVVLNDTTVLASPSNAANLVIIAHSSMMTQAQAWADYRRSQGITVAVVETSEIYDEFNYGVLSSDSIRSFLSYAASNWQTPPGYVLLIGDASFDSRNYQGTGYFNMVPTKFVDTIFSETGSDEALVDFNGDGLAEVSIGRIPVRIPQQAADILARQISWEAAVTTPLNRGAVFAYDIYDANHNYDFGAWSAEIRDRLPVGTPVTMIGRESPTAQTDLIAAFNAGPYLVNYSGHGTTGAWASTGFFWNGNVPQLVNPPASRPIYTMLTCLTGYFMNLTNDSLSELLLKSTNGGAVSAWASTGETEPGVQQIMALRFYTQIGSGPPTLNRLGDLVRDAKSQVDAGSDVRLSWALLGDPMLKVK